MYLFFVTSDILILWSHGATWQSLSRCLCRHASLWGPGALAGALCLQDFYFLVVQGTVRLWGEQNMIQEYNNKFLWFLKRSLINDIHWLLKACAESPENREESMKGVWFLPTLQMDLVQTPLYTHNDATWKRLGIQKWIFKREEANNMRHKCPFCHLGGQWL